MCTALVSARDAELAPYLPRLVRAWSDEDDGASRVRTVDGSLVSTDVSGFTALSERLAARGREGAEELVETISGVFDELIQVAERHGGDVLKFRGDALLLLFVGDRHPERACGAASDMQRAIESLAGRETSVGPVELRMACGVHSGDVHLFLTRVPQRELLVAGSAASRVFALEDVAGAGEVMLSDETAARVDPAWLGEGKDGGRLLRLLEPGASPIPPPDVVGGHDLAAYVPRALRDHLAVASGEAEHRQVTVAFVKVSGTDEADADPVALGRKLDALSVAVAAACERYGLTWLESDIDGDAAKVYLTAGAPSTTGQDEEAMVRALREIIAGEVGLPLQAGVNRGRVFTGDIGSESRRTYAVMGDAVNLAARLTARAKPGAILATADVLDRTRTTYATDVEPLLVKGKEAAVMAHSVGEPTGARGRSSPDAGPFVGRERELDLIREAIGKARIRELRQIEIVADPGVGKSRLVAEARALAVGFQQLDAIGEPYAQGEPFAAVRPFLRQLVGTTPETPREQAGEQLALFVGSVAPDLAGWLPLLALPFDAQVDSTPEADALGPAAARDRRHEILAALLERLLMMPTLLVVEDAHWLDDASHGFLAHLVSGPAGRPWAVLVTSRPGAPSLAGPESPVTRIELAPLGADAATELALGVSDAPLSAETVATLVARSGGNPLFVRALVLAAGAGRPVDALPETVESLLTAMIDTLAPADRMLLRHAAVVGPTFDASLVEEVLGSEARDGSRWDAVAQFVAPDGDDGLRFRHDLVRVTAYEGLSFRRRREIHRKVGEALERRARGRERDEAALLSLHFHEAGAHEKAWHYAVAAADRAAAGFANVDAALLYERALSSGESLGTAPREELARASEALGDVCERFADYARSASAYERAVAASDGQPVAVARLGGKLAALEEHAGRYDEALARYDTALATLDDTSAHRQTRAGLEAGRAGVLYRQARYADCLAWAGRAAESAETSGDRAVLAQALYLTGSALAELGRDGSRELERAVGIYVELGDFVGEARALNNVGVSRHAAGRWVEATAAYRASREARSRAGDVIGAAVTINNEAEILSDQGHLDEAESIFEDMIRTCRAAGYALGALVGLGNLGRVAARSGRFDEAHARYAEALEGFAQIGAESFVTETRMRIVECCVLAGEHARALDLLPELDEGSSPAVERLRGYALTQARRDEDAASHFARSLELSRAQGSAYEEALSLRAIADTAGDEAARTESDALLSRLGVTGLPHVPLP